jgi:ribosome-associated protein
MPDKNKQTSESKQLSDLVVEGMLDKKATNIVVMDLKDVKNAVADYFILCSGNSDTQIDAISDAIEEAVFKKVKENPWKKEGRENKEWILIDYVSVVAHVFNKDKRKFYGLDELWGDADIRHIDQ